MGLAALYDAQTADQLVQKNIEAKGGIEKLKAIKTVRLTGKLDGSGVECDIFQLLSHCPPIARTFSRAKWWDGAVRVACKWRGVFFICGDESDPAGDLVTGYQSAGLFEFSVAGQPGNQFGHGPGFFSAARAVS